MKKLERRTFMKEGTRLGLSAMLGGKLVWERPKDAVRNGVVQSGPLCTVKKEVRIACPELGLAPVTHMQYIGKGLIREEQLSFMQSSDWTLMELKRTSQDNGESWTPWKPVQRETQSSGKYTMSGGVSQSGTGPLDPASGMLIKPVFQRIFEGDPTVALSKLWRGERLFWDHGFVQLSQDNGRTWGEAIQLKYEDGPDFDPSDWEKSGWLKRNEMYIGNAIVTSQGNVVVSATVPVPYSDPEDEEYPSVFPNNYREGCVAGAMCFVGQWDSNSGRYQWKKSNGVFLPRRMSSRGLVELNICELRNGNLLMIMRGSDTPVSPGRKWYSLSRDGGVTWSPVTDMRYDTGDQCYSSASIHQAFRSSKNGKLYWVGNISQEPPKGNYPRYPLVIVEIDEEGPSFIKDSLTVIDTRDPQVDTDKVQMSNFALLENRESHEVEIYLTRLGENENTWSANAYKYTLTF